MLRNEKGMTLIEVVASIVILTIILVSFASFFIQNNKTASHNNEKLIVTNLADAALVKIQNMTFVKTQDHKNAEANNSSYNLNKYFIDSTIPQPTPENRKPPTAIIMNNKTYSVVYEAKQNSNAQAVTGYSEKDLNILNVIVTVTAPNGKTKSSTEGYVYLE